MGGGRGRHSLLQLDLNKNNAVQAYIQTLCILDYVVDVPVIE